MITRDNQLISLPSANDYEFAKAAAAAYTNPLLQQRSPSSQISDALPGVESQVRIASPILIERLDYDFIVENPRLSAKNGLVGTISS